MLQISTDVSLPKERLDERGHRDRSRKLAIVTMQGVGRYARIYFCGETRLQENCGVNMAAVMQVIIERHLSRNQDYVSPRTRSSKLCVVVKRCRVHIAVGSDKARQSVGGGDDDDRDG